MVFLALIKMDVSNLPINIIDPVQTARDNINNSSRWFFNVLNKDIDFHDLRADCGIGMILLHIYKHPAIRGRQVLIDLDLEPVRNSDFISIICAAKLVSNTIVTKVEDHDKGGLHITELGILLLKQSGLLP